LAYWFLNLNELIAALREEGYAVVMESAADRRLTRFAVPRQYRLDRSRNLLFARADGSAE
jgi:hypothetical protein